MAETSPLRVDLAQDDLVALIDSMGRPMTEDPYTGWRGRAAVWRGARGAA